MVPSESNEFCFLVLNKKTSWEEGLLASLTASDEGIKLKETLNYAVERTINLEEIRSGLKIDDLAVGKCQLLYLLDANARSIYLLNSNQERIEKIDCIQTYFSHPISITLTSNALYVANDEGKQRIFSFMTKYWQIKWIAESSKDAIGNKINLTQELIPADLAVDQNESLYVLDRRNCAIVQFDRIGRFITTFGQKELCGKQPSAISLSQDGAIYILECETKRVLKFVAGKMEFSFQIKLPIKPSGLAIDRDGCLYIGDCRIVHYNDEDNRCIYKFSSSGELIDKISDYRGSVEKIRIDSENKLYVFDKEQQKITILKQKKTYSEKEKNSLSTGWYVSRSLDSKQQGIKWHKLVLDTEIRDNTQIEISYLTAEQRDFYLNGKKRDLDEFLVDHSKSSEEKLEILKRLNWSVSIVNPKDALIHAPEGRYLWLRIKLIGSEKVTPIIKNIRAVFSRMSYLRYLPAIYQEDESSRDFLERFLSLFETFFTNLESEIDHITRFFDADAVSIDFLRWLASWLSIIPDGNWPEEKLRLLVKKAPELYKMRGTREGLEEIFCLFTGKKPLILESFQLEGIKNDYNQDPYSFYVLLDPFQVKNEKELEILRRILDLEKPAYTCAVLILLQPCISLDGHTYLERNSYILNPSFQLDSGAIMQHDTILIDNHDCGQMEINCRLDIDANLN
ncbi:phage tail protein [Bacillus toyonensis]|uniref:phage tail protein n=1 Tax=Bacillus toyonensis TaxID=155322 RepID=UPI001C02EFCE|nr:phage tail protein [Bacillus toyonensis]